MGFNIIPASISSLPSEKRQVAQLIKNEYDGKPFDTFLYTSPKIKNLQPDFLLIVPNRGVAFINVTGIRASQIDGINRRQISLKDGDIIDNPVFRANQNHNLSKALFESDDRLFDKDGFPIVKTFSVVIFTNLRRELVSANSKFFNQPPTKIITADELANFSEELFFDENMNSLNDNHIRLIRATLFPEIKIFDAVKSQDEPQEIGEFSDEISNKIKALDSEQETFAKRIPFGHYMVTGVPGSGKTVILLSRALYLVKENPEWQILIVTYNRSLAKKLEDRLNQFAADYNFMGINFKNITVKTFHRVALDIAKISVPTNADNIFWRETLPQKALELVTPIFDAILIDEYQDFYDDWLKLCINLCKETEYKNSSGDTVKGINLFLAGDRLQSIYNERELSWAQLGINMQGRSKLLKKTYRTGKEHINLALDFLMAEQTLTKEVENFYEGREDISNEAQIENRVEFIEGDYTVVSDLLEKLILNAHYKPEDILVLCKSNYSAEKLHATLSPKIKSQTIVSKEPIDGLATLTTYHSSKGLEGLVCILVDTDKFKTDELENELLARKLFYVGMTRASQYLYIHANEFKLNCFGTMVKERNFG